MPLKSRTQPGPNGPFLLGADGDPCESGQIYCASNIRIFGGRARGLPTPQDASDRPVRCVAGTSVKRNGSSPALATCVAGRTATAPWKAGMETSVVGGSLTSEAVSPGSQAPSVAPCEAMSASSDVSSVSTISMSRTKIAQSGFLLRRTAWCENPECLSARTIRAGGHLMLRRRTGHASSNHLGARPHHPGPSRRSGAALLHHINSHHYIRNNW
jgi:hypothetical protein